MSPSLFVNTVQASECVTVIDVVTSRLTVAETHALVRDRYILCGSNLVAGATTTLHCGYWDRRRDGQLTLACMEITSTFQVWYLVDDGG